MYRLGTWAARALGNFRRIEFPGQKIAAAMGLSAGAILLSGVIEMVATAVLYASLMIAMGYLIFLWIQKSRGAA